MTYTFNIYLTQGDESILLPLTLQEDIDGEIELKIYGEDVPLWLRRFEGFPDDEALQNTFDKARKDYYEGDVRR